MEIAFNKATRELNINYDREEFYNFMRGLEGITPTRLQERTLAEWQGWYEIFLINDDARDLASTQADALGVLF